MRFEGSFLDIKPDGRLECGICWWVYDPAAGDDVRAVPPGVAFADLPADWCCPGCDAPKFKFMAIE